MFKVTSCLTLIASLVLPVGALHAKNLSAESGERQNLLLELYTSQGCSSCPPADDWLSGLKQDQRLWKNIFPVAFHVDYWNYIGWTDPYSTDVYSNRQRNYARKGNVSSVYTPGFIVNGKEWRSWFRRRDINAIMDKFNDNPGNLAIMLEGNQFQAVFQPKENMAGKLTLNAAWLSMNISTDVLDGENGGKTLHHDFVARSWQRIEGKLEDGKYNWKKLINSEQINKSDALVVWISSQDNPAPIQTTGFLLNSPK